jgi:hypothetical protein
MSEYDSKVIKKINKLEKLKTVFTTLAIVIGVITIIDLILPDPILFIDEVVFTSLTGLFTIIMATIDDKIKKLQTGVNAKVTIDEVKEITDAVTETANTIKKSKNNRSISKK